MIVKKKLPKETIDLLKGMGSVVLLGKTFYFLPFWFKETEEDGVFEIIHPDNLPKELIDALKELSK